MTTPRLSELAAQYANNPDIDALLWEIKRMRMKLRHIHDDLHEDRDMSRGEIRRIRRSMASEPCIREHIDGQPSLF